MHAWAAKLFTVIILRVSLTIATCMQISCFINVRRMRTSVTVLGLCVCVCVSAVYKKLKSVVLQFAYLQALH
jgi:hypothetical protein